MRRIVLLTGLLLAVFSCTREEDSFREEGIRFSAVGAASANTKTAYDGTEDPTEHKERIDWIAGDRVRVWSNRARAGIPPQDNADYVVKTVTTSGLESIGTVEALHDPLNWKSDAHIFYALYPSPTTEDMDGFISFTDCDLGFEDAFKITCTLPQHETITWTDDGDLRRGYPDMRHAYLWATASAATPTHDVVSLAFHPRFTAFEFVFTSSKIPEIHLKSLTLETTDDSPLFGTFIIHNDGTVSDAEFTGTTSSVTYNLNQIIQKDKYLSITLLALYNDVHDIGPLKITVTGDEILTRSLVIEKTDHTPITYPGGKKYRFVNLDFPAVFAEGEGIQWNERLQILGVGEPLTWIALQEILAHGADVGLDVTEDTDATTGEDMKDPDKEDQEADGQDMLPDNSGQTLTAHFTDTPAIDFTWHSADRADIHYNIPEASCKAFFSSKLISGAGTTTATFQVSKSGVRDGYALYPTTLAIEDASGTGGDPLRVTLPDSWNVDETPMPLPMAAVNTEGDDLNFKALGGVLRLSLNNIPAGTKSITLTTDRPICGEFNVDVSGPDPVLSSAVITSSGNVVQLNFSTIFTVPTDDVLDIPLPPGSYPSLIVKAHTASKLLLGIATDYSSPSIARAVITPLTMEMDSEGAITDFTVSPDISFMAGQAGGKLDYSIKQILAGGGTGEASGYTLSMESNSDPEVVGVAFGTDPVTGKPTVQLTPLAVGQSIVTLCAHKGNVTLKSSSLVTVTNISGIGFRVSYPYVPLRNSHVEEAFPVVDAAEVSGSFTYKWTIDSGSDKAVIDGDDNNARVRITAGDTATGDVVLRCTIYTGGRICATATRTVKVFQVPEGCVNGVFSIENGTAVVFASGNLTYQKSTGQYTLQEHQWSAYSGIVSSKKPTDADEDYYDVFRYVNVGSTNNVESSMADPFIDRHASPAVHIGSNDTYGWYLPTRRQFNYIFTGRTGGILPQIGASNGRYMFVMLNVGGDLKEGVFVFPDCFVWPAALPLPTRLDGGNSNMVFDTYSLDDFTSYLEPLGCLFLPGGHAAPGYDELGKENLNTKERFFGRYLVYYDGSRGYYFCTFYNYTGAPVNNFTTPTSSQTMSFGALAGNMPNRWFHIRTAKRYEEVYAR